MSKLQEISETLHGGSYWHVELSTGKKLSQLDTIVDIKTASKRRAEWLEDIIATGDIAQVRTLTLCTPTGNAHISSERPYSFFQFNTGGFNMLEGKRVKIAQIIGCLEDDKGGCVCHIWDLLEQKLYIDHHTNVYDFAPWHGGVQPIGRIAVETLEVRI